MKSSSTAKISSIIIEKGNSLPLNILSIFGGLCLLIALAQVAIPLPWTPVPITGQTLGVSLIGLLWGFKRGISVVGVYLALGALGAPIFVGASSGLFGSTSGYLLGMFFSVAVIGYLSDKGFCNTFFKSLVVCYLGSVFVFFFGAFVLKAFIGVESVFYVGILPFLAGDFIKNTLASGISRAAQKL